MKVNIQVGTSFTKDIKIFKIWKDMFFNNYWYEFFFKILIAHTQIGAWHCMCTKFWSDLIHLLHKFGQDFYFEYKIMSKTIPWCIMGKEDITYPQARFEDPESSKA